METGAKCRGADDIPEIRAARTWDDLPEKKGRAPGIQSARPEVEFAMIVIW